MTWPDCSNSVSGLIEAPRTFEARLMLEHAIRKSVLTYRLQLVILSGKNAASII